MPKLPRLPKKFGFRRGIVQGTGRLVVDANAAGSTLARSLLTDTAFWPALGIESLNSTSVGPWIRQNADRENFYAANGVMRAQFESFVDAKLDPLYDGGVA